MINSIISKILIKAASEKKKEFIKNKYDLSDEEISLLEEADPTSQGKYLEWLANMYKKGSLRLPEDSFVIKPALERFHKIKDKRVFTDEKDINKYSSPGSLYRVLEKYGEGLEEESKDLLKRKEQAGDGYREIAKGPGYVWFEVTTPEAACALGSGTSWCTVHENYSEEYLRSGPLYILYEKGKPTLQFHYKSNQIMDKYDNPIGEIIFVQENLPEFLKLKPEMERYGEKLKQLFDAIGLNIAVAGSKEGKYLYQKLVEQYKDMLKELKENLSEGSKGQSKKDLGLNRILNALGKGVFKLTKDQIEELAGLFSKAISYDSLNAGITNIRDLVSYLFNNYRDIKIPELEDLLLDLDFLKRLGTTLPLFKYKSVREGDTWPEYEQFVLNSLKNLMTKLEVPHQSNTEGSILIDFLIRMDEYDKDLLRKAEKLIKTAPEAAYFYASYAKGNRWPEAEEVIMKDPKVAYYYTLGFIKDRWPEAEKYIMKDPYYAVRYAKNVIRGRWPEAEKYIMKDPQMAYHYAKEFIKGRWPEAEKYIMRDPDTAFYYAEQIIGGRWPEAEKYIMKNPEAALYYALYILRSRWPEAEDIILKSHRENLKNLYKARYLSE